ncbi:hypothetical protein LTS18_010001 [Coniosporium uncinatum]|uniref:Uncharacterized protein n=1 Tax=Coniosporium uncinatum TaxID=93489 RepID=A0ACC3DA60_9PEZI|nr:hypothetical protein LTS18_010001 [Coniosporium uncinatum]
MPTIAISGAGSGIGHEFLQHYAKDSSNTVHTIDVSFSDEVTDGEAPAHVTTHEVNTSEPSSIENLKNDLKDKPIDIFIHSAAVRGLVKSMTEKTDDPKGAETMEVMDAETMTMCFQVNILGSFLLIRSLIPNLKAASAQGKSKAKCVIMGSRMGSITSNNDGGSYAYRASKAGLNALIKSFSVDVPEVIFVIIHPGRVESRMTHVREEGAVDPDQAIEEMLPLIENFTEKDTGKFYVREGEEIPW